MKILGIDSSGLVASVAIVEDNDLKGEYTVNYKKTHSQTLLPMLDEVAKMIELDLNTIDAIAISGGPGSFTGLRIGSATAKGLGLALKKPLIHIPTVDALAYNLVGHRDLVCPLMDARRNQTYTGLYRFDGNEMQIVKGQSAVGIDEIVDVINETGEAVVFLGDGVDVFAENKGYFVQQHVAQHAAAHRGTKAPHDAYGRCKSVDQRLVRAGCRIDADRDDIEEGNELVRLVDNCGENIDDGRRGDGERQRHWLVEDVDVADLECHIAQKTAAQTADHRERDRAHQVELVFARNQHTRDRCGDNGEHLEPKWDSDHGIRGM